MIASLGHRERPFLILTLLTFLLIWGFVALADEVIEGDTKAIDESILLSFRETDNPAEPRGAHWVEEIARDLTGLGGTAILTVLSLATAGYLALRGRIHTTYYLVAAIGGGILISSLLKLGFNRPRPELVPHGSYVYTASFPSGHSMMSAITYLTLGALLARVESSRAIKAYLLIMAVAVTVFIGISRVYLGVHWPTDVLAGWAVGAAWATLCWSIANRLQRRGDLEGSACACG